MNPEQRRIFALFPRSGKTGLDGSPPPSGDITFPLRITNAGGDGSAEACCEQRVDLLEVRTGGATAIRNFDGRNVALHARCPNRTAAMPIVSRTSEIGRRVPRTHFLRYERAQRPLPRERPANSQTARGISARNAHNRGSRKRRRSR